eukprot:Plantae.Rhodophyta-Purpureofilum_apyrenoidigerum.ctg12988.p1 GENE.Plantae.Rhodophyta-Purpureofilum_apyrenoidigerum.ctg12988~~Plantae.Rhodophyta-Purpureofilum_apyrenoidigerum.ctg12988.p1  ORF type:complete len:736 (-),score=166.69 Plantae.Rhodophyta-Purpureofilum_apyrenoidigerum.ctg12988:231-2438(-)
MGIRERGTGGGGVATARMNRTGGGMRSRGAALWLLLVLAAASLCSTKGSVTGLGDGLVDLSARLDEIDRYSALKLGHVIEQAKSKWQSALLREDDDDDPNYSDDDDPNYGDEGDDGADDPNYDDEGDDGGADDSTDDSADDGADDSADDSANDSADDSADDSKGDDGTETDDEANTDGKEEGAQDEGKDDAPETGADKVFTVPLNGDVASSTLTTEISIGGEVFRVWIVGIDNFLIVPTSECSDCGNLPKVYEYSDQGISCAESGDDGLSCKKPEKCDEETCFFGTCTDGSCCYKDSCGWGIDITNTVKVSGRLVKDKVSLGGSAEADVLFHGMVSQTGLVKEGSFNEGINDALLGLSMNKETCYPSCVPSILDMMAEAGVISRPNFAFCIENVGGIMSFGGADPAHYKGQMTYLPLEEGKGASLAVKSITVGGKKASSRSSLSAMIDFSSVYHNMKPKVFDELRHAFQSQPEVCKVKFFCPEDGSEGIENTVFNRGSCAPASVYTDAVLDELPNVEFSVDGGQKLVVSARQYMFKTFYRETLQFYYCLAWAAEEKMDSMKDAPDLFIGGSGMLGQYVEFDRENHRLGIAEANNCSGGCQTLTTCEECTNTASCAYCGLESECAMKADKLFQLCPQAIDDSSKCSAIEGSNDDMDSWSSVNGTSETAGTESATSSTGTGSKKTFFVILAAGSVFGVAIVMLTTLLKGRRQRNPFERLREEGDLEESDEQEEPMYR